MTFDFSTFPVLTTERLYLRQLTTDDAPAMQILFSDEEVLRYLNNEPTTTLEQAVGMIEWLNGIFETDNAVNWAVTDKDTGRFIGICGTHNWHKTDQRLDVGYTLLRAEWGKGYATEVTHAMLAWCFENLDVHRIQADCTDGNIGSERVLLKCGFKLEGIWRESCWEHERFVDIKQFGILRREYHP